MGEQLTVGTRVQTLSGRGGVVALVAGRNIDVVFADGVETLDIDDLRRAVEGPAELLATQDPGHDVTAYGLRLQALFLQHAYRFDLRSGLSNARVEPNLHQVYIAHLVTQKLQPRMILADEVGLGKTIEAALILKELRARMAVDRVLVVCPASLQYQWQLELRSKFNEDFEIVNAAAAKYLSQGGRNPFAQRTNVICSLPFATRRADEILEAEWDLVIFDEAHRVRRKRESARKITSTQAYRLADELKELIDGLLLLTATPMQLHPFELYSLIELVEPGLYTNYEAYERRGRDLPVLNDLMRALKGWAALDTGSQQTVLEQHSGLLGDLLGNTSEVAALDDHDAREQLMDALVERHPLAGVMVRNRKRELGTFAERRASRLLVPLDDEARQLYDDITNYIQHGYDLAVADKQNAVGFLMVTYQKMLASSSYAIRESFKRRIVRLRKSLQQPPKPKKGPSREVLDEANAEADELGALADEVLDSLPVPSERQLVEAEIVMLEHFIERLEHVADAKAERLLGALDELFTADPDEKVVIFTQFRDTQTYLRHSIERNITPGDAPVKVEVFNGAMDAEAKEDAIRRFRAGAHVLISTEAGGEGRNLQFTHILVNYDLPWNPMKVEQRIGRLDRIGQHRPVLIYNLACEHTVEERVLHVLDERIQLFEESVGSLDPILGDLELDLQSLLMTDLDGSAARFEGFAQDLEQRTREAREQERVLADFIMDRASLRRDRVGELLGEQAMASSKELEQFTVDALAYHGGTLKPHVDGGHVATLSPQLRAKLRFREPQRWGVFDHATALEHEELDFFAMGHELIDGLIAHAADAETTTAVRRIPGLGGGPYVEVVYELRSDGPVNLGRVQHHLVGSDLEVRSDQVRTLPPVGERATLEHPAWTDDALAASKARFATEQEATRAELAELLEVRKDEERRRAQRIVDYRQTRLRARIEDEAAWVANAEASDSTRLKRILPARRAKLAKDRDRLAQLQADHERELAEIDARRAVVSGRIWAAGLVVGT